MSITSRTSLPLIESELLTQPTKSVLLERLKEDNEPYAPQFFTADEYRTLTAICARLLGETASAGSLSSAAAAVSGVSRAIDMRLAQRVTDGWRYDALPGDETAYRLGIEALQRGAKELYGNSLFGLEDEQIDRLLSSAESRSLSTSAVEAFDVSLWFGEILAEAVECFYSHPQALDEIGYVGFADAPGWTRIGLNNLERREAATIDGGGA